MSEHCSDVKTGEVVSLTKLSLSLSLTSRKRMVLKEHKKQLRMKDDVEICLSEDVTRHTAMVKKTI